jgi:hypothetical protein
VLSGENGTVLLSSRTHEKLGEWEAKGDLGVYLSSDYCITLNKNNYCIIPLSESEITVGMQGRELCS